MNEPRPSIDFDRIRPHEGDQRNGFEQLAVELFAREHHVNRRLIRVEGAGGDGGVEAYADVAGIGKVGTQAKYFKRLETKQWAQISDSVETALREHSDLKQYHVYVPLDRTTGRSGKSKGHVEKWNELVEVWHMLPNGANVEFIWHGKHEIGLSLKQATNHDLLFYWFGTPLFDKAWLDRILEASLRSLGERYQPARHVQPNVGRELDRFVWSPAHASSAEQAFVTVAEECLDFTKTLHNFPLTNEDAKYRLAIRAEIDGVIRNEFPVYGVRQAGQIAEAAQSLLQSVRNLRRCFQGQLPEPGAPSDEKLEYRIETLDRFARKIDHWIDLLESFRPADHQLVLVRGDAGSGKSHLLAHTAVKALNRNQPALMVLGEQFLDGRSPLIQLCELAHWNNGPESLLSALSVAGSLAQAPALLIIDALNESDERRLWKSHLHSLVTEIQRFPHIRLIVSCRSDFVGITLPEAFKSGVPVGWSHINHRGFGDALAEAVARYFSSYSIQSTHFPPLLDEFRNPLFLDTFCRAFEGQRIPDGPISLQTVMERAITRLAKKMEEVIDCDEFRVRSAITNFTKQIRQNNGRPVEKSIALAAIDPFSPSNERSRSLYTHLVSNRLLVERIDRYWEEDPQILVRFGFERFSDYFVASGLLSSIADVDKLRDQFSGSGSLAWMMRSEEYFDNHGLATALAILVPEKFGVELVDAVPPVEHIGNLLGDLLSSLPWRSKSSIGESTESHVMEASRYGRPSWFVDVLLRISTIPSHPFNAEFLHNNLMAKGLPERDSIWTIPIQALAAESDSVASSLIDWALQVPQQLISDEQASLAATVLLWFGSSNSVRFRSHAGRAAIRILCGRSHIVNELVNKFDSVNDPYVVERVYAVACGVAMHEPRGDGLKQLATTVYKLVFTADTVRPHILVRDYAQTLLSAAEHKGCLDAAIDAKRFRPPFASVMPEIIDEDAAKKIEDDEEWRKIVWSVRPEGLGMYGDFGRYEMGHAVHGFLEATKDQPIPEDSIWHRYDDKRARRWVLQRVKSLGWSHEFFGEYDSHRHDDRITEPKQKIERIGKKYQWIALHELLGYLSDYHHMYPWWGDKLKIFRGVWQLDERNFDPSQEAVPERSSFSDEDEETDESPTEKAAVETWQYLQPYPDPFADLKLLSDRAAWVKTKPDDPKNLISVTSEGDSKRWLVLDGYWSWNEPRIHRVRNGWDGRCKMWAHLRSWIVRKKDVNAFVSRIKKVSLWGQGIQGIGLGNGWIGEYPYSEAFSSVREACEQPDELVKSDKCKHIRATCEWDERGRAIVPSPQLCDILGIYWAGQGATFNDLSGTAITTTAALENIGGTPACVVREDALRCALDREGLTLVWGAVGERDCWNGEKHLGDAETQFSGIYRLSEEGIKGGLTVVEVIPLPIPSEKLARPPFSLDDDFPLDDD